MARRPGRSLSSHRHVVMRDGKQHVLDAPGNEDTFPEFVDGVLQWANPWVRVRVKGSRGVKRRLVRRDEIVRVELADAAAKPRARR